MSNSSFPTFTAILAQQSQNSPSAQATPPLLPAFLITGLLLATIVSIIVWRHIIERRNGRREEDPTWPILDGVVGSGIGGYKGPTPKIWDLEVMNESERAAWEDIMPLSVTALRAAPKPRRPRYLVPSDRPVTFFTRMFGGERRPPRPAPPPISIFAPTQALPDVAPPDDDDEEPIDRLQVVVLISLPHPRRGHAAHLSENLKENTDFRSAEGDTTNDREGTETEDASFPSKGKKRSLEKPISDESDPKAYRDDGDENGLAEVGFGIMVMPFAIGEG